MPISKILKEIARRAESGVDEVAKTFINAWHGSPHDFDKFDMSKLGTGEGAQAYGHGLYFAEQKSVSEGYREALKVGAGPQEHNRVVGEIQEMLADPNTDIFPDEADIDTILNNAIEFNVPLEEVGSVLADSGMEGVINQILNNPHALNRANALIDKSKGKLYNVNIDASPDELLDWDLPLSEQPEKVQDGMEEVLRGSINDPDGAAVMGFDGEIIDRASDYDTPEEWLRSVKVYKKRGHRISTNVELERNKIGGGEGYHTYLAEKYGGQDKLSEAMSAAGIKGIKYKDGFSRGSDGGSSNYVIFDDKTINIIGKYGIAAAATGIAATQSPYSRASANKAIAELTRRGHVGQRIEASGSPFLTDAANLLADVDTPFGRPYEATADLLRKVSYGDAPSKMDIGLTALEVLDPTALPLVIIQAAKRELARR